MGSIPVGDSEFFFVPSSCHVEHLIFSTMDVFSFDRRVLTFESNVQKKDEQSVKIGVTSFFAIHLVLVFIALIDTGAEQPRWWEKLARFKVRYQSDEFGEEGEGEILLIVPRNPQHGVNDGMDGNRSTNLHPFDAPDGVFFTQDEVNNLTLCCCECCHRQACQGLSKICCNVFPQHSTANQFFTSKMFSAYHCEGYGACVDANAVGFLRNGDKEREQNDNVNIV
ncbi:hypothetical protein ACROYT_G010647 [Oculina patagonica]